MDIEQIEQPTHQLPLGAAGHFQWPLWKTLSRIEAGEVARTKHGKMGL